MLESSVRPEPFKTLSECTTYIACKAHEATTSTFRKSNGIDWNSDEMPVGVADNGIEHTFHNRYQTCFHDDRIFGNHTVFSSCVFSLLWDDNPTGNTVSFVTCIPLRIDIYKAAAVGVFSTGVTSKRENAQRDIGAALNHNTSVTYGRPARGSTQNFPSYYSKVLIEI